MKDFWRTDWFLGVVVIAIALFNRLNDLIPSLERKAYDPGVTATARTPSAPPAPRTDDPAQSVGGPAFAQFKGLLQEAEQTRNTDRKLADRFTRAGNVVPMQRAVGLALRDPELELHQPADILTYNPILQPEVVDMINKALNKQVDERFQSGDEMAAAIRAAASDTMIDTTTVDFNL
jgi:hypothetical protein